MPLESSSVKGGAQRQALSRLPKMRLFKCAFLKYGTLPRMGQNPVEESRMRVLFFPLLLVLCLALPPDALAAAQAEKPVAAKAETGEESSSEALAGKAPDKVTDKGADRAEKIPAPQLGESRDVRGQVRPEETLPVGGTWDTVWSGQRAMLEDFNSKAKELGQTFNQSAANLGQKVQPFLGEARRLMVLVNTYRSWPNPLEAVGRRITATILDLRELLDPLMVVRGETQALLERISYLADSMPEDMQDGASHPEIQEYARTLTLTRLRLTGVLAQCDLALAPSLALISRLEKTRGEISAQLPMLWEDYYLQRPVPWLSPKVWEDFGRQIQNSFQGMMLRLPVEVPVTGEGWGIAGLRFVLGLLLTGLLTTLLYRRLKTDSTDPTVCHIFQVSLPWLCVGLAFLSASLSAAGEFFRLFLALGNLCFIMAQIYLAWDLRLLKYSSVERRRTPFWYLVWPTFCSYVLLYLPLTQPLVLVIWLGILVFALLRRRGRPKEDLGPLHLENSVLECEPIVLWLCLVLALVGLHIYSMVLYLLFVSCSLALQLSMGGMALVSRCNDNLPAEGVRAALAHLLVALAAPVVLVVAFVGVSQWVGTLPGGMHLLQHYIQHGISVGSARLNLLHLLLIISMFYLTRTAVSMGSLFLSRLPKQDIPIDATLIPPVQTAFTYALWCFFGLFVLRALGMELSNLAIVAGGLSVGIGFGMQTIINNFLSGLILIFSRTLQAGDVVEVGGIQGRVRKISVRATMVETFDNALIIVPNSEFVANRLINWTRNSRTVRREVRVGVAYGSDVADVMNILLAKANANANVLKYPPPSAFFTEFGSSTLDFCLRFWVRDYDVGMSTASDIRLEIEKEFRLQGIEVAFPQLDVHIRDMPSRASLIPAPAGNSSAGRRRPRRARPARTAAHGGAAPQEKKTGQE